MGCRGAPRHYLRPRIDYPTPFPLRAQSDRTRPSNYFALGEYDTGWHDPTRSLAEIRSLAQSARAAGAKVLVLPEMCTTGFTMAADEFAETPEGPAIRELSEIAASSGIWLIAGVAMRRDEKFLNSALAFAPDGTVKATYDKQRLFGYARENEIYSAGISSCVVKIGGLSVGLFICFDLRFPDLFRTVAPFVDAFVLVANWPSTRQRHWEILTQARAIENQCYMIAVNRIGEADGLRYEGGSMIIDPWGERIDAAASGSVLRIGAVSEVKVDEVRKAFPIANFLEQKK